MATAGARSGTRQTHSSPVQKSQSEFEYPESANELSQKAPSKRTWDDVKKKKKKQKNKGRRSTAIPETPEKKKSGGNRVFSDEDQIDLLQAKIDYHSQKEAGTLANVKNFYDFVKDKLNVKVSVNQVNEKLRRLKQRFNDVPPTSNPVDLQIFQLSEKIWGSESIIGSNAVEKNKARKRKSPKKKKKEEEDEGTVSERTAGVQAMDAARAETRPPSEEDKEPPAEEQDEGVDAESEGDREKPHTQSSESESDSSKSAHGYIIKPLLQPTPRLHKSPESYSKSSSKRTKSKAVKDPEKKSGGWLSTDDDSDAPEKSKGKKKKAPKDEEIGLRKKMKKDITLVEKDEQTTPKGKVNWADAADGKDDQTIAERVGIQAIAEEGENDQSVGRGSGKQVATNGVVQVEMEKGEEFQSKYPHFLNSLSAKYYPFTPEETLCEWKENALLLDGSVAEKVEKKWAKVWEEYDKLGGVVADLVSLQAKLVRDEEVPL